MSIENTKNMDEIRTKYPEKKFDGYSQGGAELYEIVRELEKRVIKLENELKIERQIN